MGPRGHGLQWQLAAMYLEDFIEEELEIKVSLQRLTSFARDLNLRPGELEAEFLGDCFKSLSLDPQIRRGRTRIGQKNAKRTTGNLPS